ncbi:MAG: EamA family transporter RarD [Ornithinimicrobium sp.]
MNPSPVEAHAPAGETNDSGGVARGTAYGLAAYGLWGLFPLYLLLLKPAGAAEVLVHRVLWAFALCLLLLALAGRLRWIKHLFSRPRMLLAATAGGVLIGINWTIYTFAVLSEHVTEAALGYFLNPLVTVALGVIVLRERLRVAQWVAVGLGAIAAIYLSIDYGSPPWISVALALSFASYGLVKKRIGTSLSALQSLTAETMVIAPVALMALIYLSLTGAATFTTEGPGHAVLLASGGVATTIPLLFFAAAARRVPLTTIGLLQFLTPVLQLLTAVVLLGEQMPDSRWWGFIVVWAALAVLTVDSLTNANRAHRAHRMAARAAL